MRGKRAKLLRTMSVTYHTPEKAHELLTKDMGTRSANVFELGQPKKRTVTVSLVQHHPDSLRGAYQRVKTAYKKWMSGPKRSGGYAI